jgi:hypothetical protein
MKIAWAAALTIALLAADPALSAPPASEAIFTKLVEDRLTAYRNGDSDTYLALVTHDFVHIIDTGVRRERNDMGAFVSARGAQGIRIANLRYRRVGANMALVECELVEPTGRIRESDLLVWKGGRWLFQHHQETVILEQPIAVAVPAATLDDYVGRYRLPDGTVERITRQGDTLYGAGSPEEAPVALVAIADAMFGIPGDSSVGLFVRNAQGRVTHQIIHYASGLTETAIRID